jgi:hypothetical protein
MIGQNDFIKYVAKLEREMDSGEIPFVVLDGTRYPVTPEEVEKFGLVSGQTVNRIILSVLVADMQTATFNSDINKILDTKSPDEKSEPGVGPQEFKDELKDAMQEYAAKVEELLGQKELQPRGTEEDINSKGSSEPTPVKDTPSADPSTSTEPESCR